MAEKDEDGPSLELPSLGFGRRRRKGSQRTPAQAPVESPEQPDDAEQPTEVLPATPSDPGPATPARAAPTAPPARDAAPHPRAPGAVLADEAPASTPGRRTVTLPALGGFRASLVTGLLAGGVLVGLVWASLGGCELARGTSTCGTAGFFLLLAALVVTGVVGHQLLRAFGVSDPGSTSILGTGLVAVVSLLFLGEQLFAWWMTLVVPAVAAGAFALAHRVTTMAEVPTDDARR